METSDFKSKAIARMVKHGISDKAQLWLINALDPFHDVNTPLAGYPGTELRNTIVVHNKMMAEVTSSFGADQNWDLHVFTLPEACKQVGFISDTIVNNVYPSGNINPLPANSNVNWGLINAWTGETGIYLGIPNAVSGDAMIANWGTYTWTPFSVYDQMTTRYMPHRLVAMGFEVHSVGPELYRAGNVVVYRQNQINYDEELLTYYNVETEKEALQPKKGLAAQVTDGLKTITATNPEFRWYVASDSPPGNMNEARRVVNSRSWEAKRGCYVVCSMMGDQNPFVPTKWGERILRCYNDDADTAFATACDYPQVGYSVSGHRIDPVPWNTSGAYFSGLAPTDVMQVTVNLTWEIAPTPNDTTYLNLATQGTPYDANAIALYYSILKKLPAGVPVSENAKGDFWRTVLKVMDVVLPSLLPLIPYAGPILSTAYPMVKSGVEVARRQVVRGKNRSQPKKKNRKGRKNRSKA